MFKNKKRLRIFSLLTAITLLAAAALMFVPRFAKTKPTETSFESTGMPFFLNTAAADAVLTDANGNTLLFNADTKALLFKDAATDKIWNPCSLTSSKSGLSALLRVKIRDAKGNAYVFNSTDNSVSLGQAVSERAPDGLKLTFTFFKDESAAKKGYDKKGLNFTIPLEFSVENGGFQAVVDCAEIKLPKGLYIEELSILPGILAQNGIGTGQSFLIPDGCGASVDLTSAAERDFSLCLPVYGADLATGSSDASATLPAFASIDGSSMLTCFLKDGAALGNIFCNREAGKTGGLLYNSFTVTPVVITGDEVKKGVSYRGVLSLMLHLTDGTSANDSAMAVAVRDFLTEQNELPDAITADTDQLPFMLTLIGSADGTRNSKLTTFENAEEIIAFLYSKGLRNMQVRFTGALSGGLSATAESGVNTMLGGKNGLSALSVTAAKYKATVYLDSNVLNGNDRLLSAAGEKPKIDAAKGCRTYLKQASVTSGVSSYRTLLSNISPTLSRIEKVSGCALCINDASKYLYSDSASDLTKQGVADGLAAHFSAFNLYQNVMVSFPAAYQLRYVTVVSEMPESSSCAAFPGVTVIPLLQMTLHGSVIYGSVPANTQNNSWKAVLNSVEYGAVPSFVMTYSEETGLSYDAWATAAAKYYSKVKALKTTVSQRMTAHEKLTAGVYKITYDYKTVVYVNYNSTPVLADGIPVPAADFVIAG